MASSDLTVEQIFYYLKEKGGKVKNRDVVHHFKHQLTNPLTKDDARLKFKQYVNTLAYSKLEGDEKYLYLKTKYANLMEPPTFVTSVRTPTSPQYDPRNSVGIPLSPTVSLSDFSPTRNISSPQRQPPPYRPPPPPPISSPSPSLDSISLSSLSLQDTPQAPPRRKNSDKVRSFENEKRASTDDGITIINIDDKQTVSVKERTQKFNRLASHEDELSPKAKTPDKSKNWGADEDDGAFDKPVEQKKCVEWYVTASKGDLQELIKLANSEPRLVNKKDPFTAYSVLHWGAKYGNAEIIKMFAGKYKVNVNGKTNGGYTPLHICAQFGHLELFKLLIEVYKADAKIRDYSGKTADFYFSIDKKHKEGSIQSSKSKGRKKQSDKDLGFLRIGSLNVRVKKTTEAFSNFLGVGSSINPMDTMVEKIHKGWGSADNVNKDENMAAPKGYAPKKKTKKVHDLEVNSTPSTPNSTTKNIHLRNSMNDSDSDSAAGFDSNWKN